MVVPIELDEASQAAIDAARTSSDGRLLVAPRLEDRYASYGVIATVERVGRFSGGAAAAVLKAEQRARIGSGVTGPGAALWVEVEPVDDPSVTDHARELAEEYKRLVVAVLQRREAWQVIDSVHRHDRPAARSRTPPATRRTSPTTASAQLLETPDVEERLETLIEWTKRAPRRGRGHRQDRRGRPRGHGEEPARVPAAPAARRDPQGARRGRARGRRRLPRPRRGRRRARRRPRGAAARGRQAGAVQRPEPGDRLDPHLARHRARAALDRDHRGHRPTSPPPARCSTPTTTASTRSRSGSWSTSRSAPAAPSAACRSSAAAAPVR